MEKSFTPFSISSLYKSNEDEPLVEMAIRLMP